MVVSPFDEVSFETSINVAKPCDGHPPWRGVPVTTVGDLKFVELARGDKDLQAWFTGRKAYSTAVSSTITTLCALQTEASKAELGQNDDQGGGSQRSLCRLKQASKAMKELVCDSSTKTVAVTLPEFEVNGKRFPAVETVMPYDISPHKASLRLNSDVFRWAFAKCQAEMPAPLHLSGKGSIKRKAIDIAACAAPSSSAMGAELPLFGEAHPSHQLCVLRGVLYCSRCGGFGVERTRKLISACEPPTDSGKEVLSRLARGLSPKSGTNFPERG